MGKRRIRECPQTVLGALVLVLLTTCPLPATAQEIVLFSDGFEHGAASWQLQSPWAVVADGTNHVLSGSQHVWAFLLGGDQIGDVQSFESRIRLESGSLHVCYRIAPSGGARYYVRLEPAGITLKKSSLKQPPPPTGDLWEQRVLAVGTTPVTLGAWHTLRIVGVGSRIEVWWDGTQQIACTDEINPLPAGTIAFEALPETTRVDVDDVVLKGAPPAGPVWSFTGGPRGGIGYDLAIDPRDPDVIWVTDAFAGAHRSTDGGRTWAARNHGITARSGPAGEAIPIFSLTIDRARPDTIWVGTMGMRGVFKSTDGGTTWTEMDNGIATRPVMEVRSFTVDPRDSNVVYCGGNYLADAVTRKQRGFIYKTTDGGASWRLLVEPGALVRWIILDPTNPDIVYASTGIFDRHAVQVEGVLKSTDAGTTWAHINEGLTTLAVGALAMHPANPQVLLAGTGKASGITDSPDEINGGVFKTTDGGAHWRQVDPIHANGNHEIRFSAIAFAPSNPSIVYASTGYIVLRSTDGGETWATYHVPADGEFYGQPIAMVVHPTDPDTIFVNGYGGGVFVSSDAGRSWQDASKGYTGNQVWAIAVDPEDPDYVAAGSKNGTYRSTDGGGHWQGRNTAPDRYPWCLELRSLAIDPSSRDTWLLGEQDWGTIFRTTDGGASWHGVLPPLATDASTFNRRSVHAIAFAPSQPATVYAATGIAVNYVDHDTRGHGVFKSTDGGLSWSAANTGLEGTSLNALSVAVHPHDPDTVYVGLLLEGVYTTTDGGAHWQPASSGLLAPEIRSLAIDPNDPDVVLAGAESGGMWRSTDGGATWKQSGAGMAPEASIRAVVFDRARPGVVYAGSQSSGVHRSTDGGVTWTLISTGLHNRAINALAITADGLHLYAATEGNGVYRLDLPAPRIVRRHLGRR
ncbi:MAG: WD40/YVTN/BNR-like repeat-containing protein [Thermoanaerobaculaceae bacterium]